MIAMLPWLRNERMLSLCMLLAAGFLAGILVTGEPADALAGKTQLSLGDYAAVLKAYVDVQGLVDYRHLKANRQKLDAFTQSLATLDPAEFSKWPDKEKIAFWINAYNALTLQAIIDHYPIKASFLKSFLFPENSIRQIPGVWDTLRFVVMGKKMTLDEIEHQTLRSRFNEPRIHMALVCASMGCPRLRNEPYTASKLDRQLDEQTTHFLNDPRQFGIDRRNHIVYLSLIFKWFGSDFIKKYGTDENFRGYPEAERAVLNFVSRYLREEDGTFLKEGGYSIEYLEYDWMLNEKAD